MSDATLLDAALGAFDLFVVGTVDDTGALLLSRDARVPTEETVVFLSGDMENEMTFVEAEQALGSVTWLMEPEPYDPQAAAEIENGMEEAAMSVADDAWDPMLAAITPMVAAAGDPSEEALRDEQEQTVEEAEKRIAQLEGMVAEMMMNAVTDEVFATSSSLAEVVVEDAKVPRFASVTGEFVELSGLMARLAAMGDPEPGTDLEDRLQAVVDRLDKLEGTISEMMDSKIEDDALPEQMEEKSEEPGTLVDETKPGAKTAAYFTNARGIRVWHDPNSGKFAPSGFISPKILAKLWKGDSSARRDLMKAVQDAREVDPGLNLDGAVARVLGPRPSDRTKALHWDSGRRSIGSGWGATRPKGNLLPNASMDRKPEMKRLPANMDRKPETNLLKSSPMADEPTRMLYPKPQRPAFLPDTATIDDMGETFTDWNIGSWTNGRGSANLSLGYSTDTNEYTLTRASMDPGGGTKTVTGRFEPGTPMKVIADALVAKGKFGSDAKMPEAPVLKSDKMQDPTKGLERLLGGSGPVDQAKFDEAVAAYDPVRREGLPQIPYPDGVLSSPDQSERERQVPNGMAVLAYTQMASDSLRALADDPNWSDRTTVGPSVLRGWADIGDKMAKRLVENLGSTQMGTARRNEIERDLADLQASMGSAIDSVDRPAEMVAIQRLVDKLSPGSPQQLPWVNGRVDVPENLPSVDPAEAERMRGLDTLNTRLVEGLAARGMRLKSDQMAGERPVMRPMDRAMADVALKQMGTWNVMAVSGGRSTLRADGSLDLPVAAGYRVRVSLAGNDTYTVERVFSRGGQDFVKGRRDGVLADELGESVYQASNFRDGPFGDSTSMLQSNAMRTFTTTMTPEMRQRLTADTNLSDAVSTDVSDTVNAGLATELDNRGIEPGDVEAAQVVWQEMFSDGYFDQTGIRLDDTTSVAAMNAYGSADELFEQTAPSTLRSSQMKVPTINGTRDVKLVDVPLENDEFFSMRKKADVVDNATGEVIGRTVQEPTGKWRGADEITVDNDGREWPMPTLWDRRQDALRSIVEAYDAQTGGGDTSTLRSSQMAADIANPDLLASDAQMRGQAPVVPNRVLDSAEVSGPRDQKAVLTTVDGTRWSYNLLGADGIEVGVSGAGYGSKDEAAAAATWAMSKSDSLVTAGRMKGRTLPLVPMADTPAMREPGAVDNAAAEVSRANPDMNIFVTNAGFGPGTYGSESVTADDVSQSSRPGYWRNGVFTPFTTAQKDRADRLDQQRADADMLGTGGDGSKTIQREARKRANARKRASDRYDAVLQVPASEQPDGASVKLFGTRYSNNGDGTWTTSTYDEATGSFTDGVATDADFDRLRAQKIAERKAKASGTLKSSAFRSGDSSADSGGLTYATDDILNDSDLLDENGDLLDVALDAVVRPRQERGYTVSEARGYTDSYLLDLIRQTESPVLRAEAKRRGLL